MSETLPQPPDLDPITLSSPSFGRARRGFEPAEVNQLLGRAADALRAWQDCDNQLRKRIEQLEGDLVEARKLDEGRIASVLGEETARIISAAREAAAEIRAKASEEADRLVKDAEETSTATANALTADAVALREEAEKMRDEAAREYSTKVEQAQHRHDELLAEAQERHDGLISTAEQRREELLAEGQERHDELIATAEQRHDELLSSAEQVLQERTSEADREATEILDAARSEGRTMVAEAREVRDRILMDLADRRRIARKQIEGAVAGRDGVIEALRAAGDAVTSIVSSLEDADTVARDHANQVAESLPDDTGEFLAALDVEQRPVEQRPIETLPVEDRVSDVTEALADTLQDVDGSEGDAQAAGVMAGEAAVVPDEDAALAHEEAGQPESSVTDTAHTVDGDDPRTVGIAEVGGTTDSAGSEVDDAEVGESTEVVSHPAEMDDVSSGSDRAVEAVEMEWSGGAIDDTSSQDVADDASHPEIGGTDTAEVQGEATVHDLFARIRAQGMGTGSDDPDDPTAETTGEDEDLDDEFEDFDDDEGEPAEEQADDDGVVIDLSTAGSGAVDELSRVAALLDSRDELLVPVERQMLRGLRRLASDEQNEVLDSLRRIKRGRPEMDDVIPTAEEMLSTFSDGILADFSAAVRAGFDFWIEAGGVTEMATFVVPADVRDRLEEIVSGFISVHRAHLERSMEQAAESGSGTDELAAAIKSVYRDWRQSSLSEMAGDLAIAGFSHGERTAAGTGVPWMWVVDNGGLPCADGEDNALAGAVMSGDSFPTGDQFPPAHSGCRCILVPADH